MKETKRWQVILLILIAGLLAVDIALRFSGRVQSPEKSSGAPEEIPQANYENETEERSYDSAYEPDAASGSEDVSVSATEQKAAESTSASALPEQESENAPPSSTVVQEQGTSETAEASTAPQHKQEENISESAAGDVQESTGDTGREAYWEDELPKS